VGRSAAALEDAVASGDEFAVMRLLDAGADPNQRSREGLTPLMLASRGGHLPIATLLLGAGVPVDAATAQGHTALLYAALQGHLSTVELLLARGADARAEAGGIPILGWLRAYGSAHGGVRAAIESAAWAAGRRRSPARRKMQGRTATG
jgi:ankyrin repeat protein